jgi:hypothetical protein
MDEGYSIIEVKFGLDLLCKRGTISVYHFFDESNSKSGSNSLRNRIILLFTK